jgi:ferric-dicitrate binding protein FerR (iron transport regulator)
MSELAGLIGWFLHLFSDLLAPSGWTRRRALVLLFLALCLAAALFAIAWPDGLP